MIKPEWGTKRTCPKCATRFYDLPEPILAFTRGEGTLCVYNMSVTSQVVTVEGVSGLTGPGVGASLTGKTLTLGPNAAAWLDVTGPVLLSV